MPLQIPGYYYDPDKGKYFKVEKSQTAPSAAAWSSDAVKRRKTEAAVERAAQRRKRELRRHVARHGLREDLVLSGLLGREIGAGMGAGLGDGGDVAAAGWAEGMVRKGNVPFGAVARGDGTNLPCLWVGGSGGDDDLGVAYTTLDEVSLLGSYIPTDQDGRIRFDPDAPLDSGRRRTLHTEPVRCPQMSSIRYHAPSHKVLLTSREPDHTCGLYLFSPPLSEPGDGKPHWLLGEANFFQRLSVNHRHRSEWLVHNSTPAPPSSDLLCVLATNAGVVRVSSNETMSLVAPPPPQLASSAASSVHRRGNNHSVPKEVFDVDFQHGNHNVIFAGGRSPKLWMGDLRAPPGTNQWSSVRHASSIARLRSVNEHQVVVCGLQSSMALYDVRFLAQRPNGAGPLVTFPGYRNEAHMHVGFDACPGLGVVAAAQEDGTVGVFSLSSGRRVRCPALAGRGAGGGRPVRALMFGEGMPGDKTPSLWVGEGLGIAKYSFGEADLAHEW